MSYYRGDFASLDDKVTGNSDFPSDLVNHPYAAAKQPDGEHLGHPVGVVTYQDGEFHCRITAQNRDWHFRGLGLDLVQDQVRRFFAAERGRITFKLDRAAWLAADGEPGALLKV
jgi:hypothetical protein